jgi:acyl dehydratase
MYRLPQAGKKLYDRCIDQHVDDSYRQKGEEIMKKKTLSDFRGAVPSKRKLDFEEGRSRAKTAVADRARDEARTGPATGKRYWEDLTEGERFTCRPVAFDREGIVAFGKEYDPWPFHADEAAAAQSIFGDVIASALHTMSACTRVVVDAHGDIAILSGLSIDEVRTPLPVRPGDVLTVEGRWDGLRRSRSRPDRGIAGVKCRVVNQRGETVMEYGYRYLVACRPSV